MQSIAEARPVEQNASHPKLKRVYRARPCGPRSHLGPNAVPPLMRECQILLLFDSVSSSPQLGLKPSTKTSKLEISVLTDVITIFNMPVNTDEGGQ